jgi:hypothetical protein
LRTSTTATYFWFPQLPAEIPQLLRLKWSEKIKMTIPQLATEIQPQRKTSGSRNIPQKSCLTCRSFSEGWAHPPKL